MSVTGGTDGTDVYEQEGYLYIRWLGEQRSKMIKYPKQYECSAQVEVTLSRCQRPVIKSKLNSYVYDAF